MKAQTRRLQAEQRRSSSLLLNMLPVTIVKQLTVSVLCHNNYATTA